MPLRAAGPFRQGSFLRTGLRAASEQPRASPQWRRPPPCPPRQAGEGRVGGVPAPAAVVAPPAATGRAVAPSLQAHGYSSPPMKAGASGRERGLRRREVCRVRRRYFAGPPARIAPPAWTPPWLPWRCAAAVRRAPHRGRCWPARDAPLVPTAASNPDHRSVSRGETYSLELDAARGTPRSDRRDQYWTQPRYRLDRRS